MLAYFDPYPWTPLGCAFYPESPHLDSRVIGLQVLPSGKPQRELRYREFVPKKQKNGDHKIRIAEIHLSKIAKLDRAEKRDSDAPTSELEPGTEAPSRGLFITNRI
jgi:hypothetical protein